MAGFWTHQVEFGRFLRLWVAPGGVDLRSWNSQEVRGSPELQNGGLKALEESWDDFLLEAFFCQVWSFSVFLGRLWVLEAGGCRLEAGGWRLGAEGWEVRA